MRIAFIGDIQGCADEFDELLARIERECAGAPPAIRLVGDLVNRGPGSLRVLQRVRRLQQDGRAQTVLGNHEIGLLRAALGLREPGPLDTAVEVLRAPDAADWIDWVRRLPLAETGQIGGRPYALVHAAVAPEWTLAELDSRARSAEARLRAADLDEVRAFLATRPGADRDRDTVARLTRCRSVGADGRWSSAEPADPGDAWHRRWSQEDPAYGVVYGHWAIQGLHVAPGLRGLDTGCVHHGRDHDGHLTAWLPDCEDPDPFRVPDPGSLIQVRAFRPYYRELLQRHPPSA